jgi:hypothetical protein
LITVRIEGVLAKERKVAKLQRMLKRAAAEGAIARRKFWSGESFPIVVKSGVSTRRTANSFGENDRRARG